MKCLLCSSEDTDYRFTYNGYDPYISKLGVKFDLKWYECRECGVFFSKQYQEIECVYEDDELYDAVYDSSAILERYYKILSLSSNSSDNFSRIERWHKYAYQHVAQDKKKQKYSVLDVGAGLGVFLKGLESDQSLILSAAEPNPVAVDHLINNVGVNVYNGYIQDLDLKEQFDFITLNRVLEHVSAPIEVMGSVRGLLNDSGLVYIELPDSDSYEKDGEGNEAFSSGHYMVYNQSSIEYLFENAGICLYEIKSVKEPSGKYTIYAFGGK